MKTPIALFASLIIMISCAQDSEVSSPRISFGVGVDIGAEQSSCGGYSDCSPRSGTDLKLGLSLPIGEAFGTENVKMRDRDPASPRPNQLVLLVRDSQNLRSRLAASGLSVLSEHRLETINATMLKLQYGGGVNGATIAQKLAGLDGIMSVQSNYIYEAKAQTNESLSLIGLDASQGGFANGRLAIVDGMVDVSHNDLQGAGITQAVIAENAKPTKHGTAIASLLVGRGKVKGVAQGVQLRSYVALQKESGTNLVGETFWIAEAIDQAIQGNPNVISLSLGGRAHDGVIEAVINTAFQKGIVVVAAVGNGGSGGSASFPASLPNVIGITAVDSSGKLYRYATTGGHVAYASLGVDLLVAAPGGYDAASGTSMATAVFAGTLMGLASDAKRSPESYVNTQISSHLRDLGPVGRDTSFGNGLLIR